DVATDREDPAPDLWHQPIAVAVGRDQHITGGQLTPRRPHDEATLLARLDIGGGRFVVELCAAIAGQAGEPGIVLCGMEAAAALEEQGAIVNGGPDLGGERVPVEDAGADAELLAQQAGLRFEMFDVTGLMGEVKVAGPRIVAIDLVGRDGFLDQGEGVEGGAIELATTVAIALEQRKGTDLEARMPHAAVSAAGTPAELVFLE